MKKEKTIILTMFIIASMFIVVVHYYNISALRWVDIPAHFIGGMMIATFFPLSLIKKRPILTISLIITIGIGWELLELTVNNLAVNDLIMRISEESTENKIQDLLFGFAGLACVYIKQKTAWRAVQIEK